MKILHVCLASFYADNYSYQENLLPKAHKDLGHEVRILASTETYVDGKKLGYIKPSEYLNENGIPVKRIPYVSYLPLKLARKLRIYPNVYEYLCEYKPDYIFSHSVSYLSINQIVRYAKENPNVRVVVDSHSDFVNSAKTFLSRYVLHGIIYRYCAHKVLPYTEIFYGTLPLRCEFLKEIYGIPSKKVGFLPMGVDDDLARKYSTAECVAAERKKHDIADDDFLIVTGGRINAKKYQMLLAMRAVSNIADKRVKMLVFGSVDDDVKEEFDSLLSDRVSYLGWANVEDAYRYFAMADLVTFPGTHSVYWEQATGLGKPLLVKYFDGITHVDMGGNVKFLYKDSTEEIQQALEEIASNKEIYERMLKIAKEKGATTFSYEAIAKKAIAATR